MVVRTKPSRLFASITMGSGIWSAGSGAGLPSGWNAAGALCWDDAAQPTSIDEPSAIAKPHEFRNQDILETFLSVIHEAHTDRAGWIEQLSVRCRGLLTGAPSIRPESACKEYSPGVIGSGNTDLYGAGLPRLIRTEEKVPSPLGLTGQGWGLRLTPCGARGDGSCSGRETHQPRHPDGYTLMGSGDVLPAPQPCVSRSKSLVHRHLRRQCCGEACSICRACLSRTNDGSDTRVAHKAPP